MVPRLPSSPEQTPEPAPQHGRRLRALPHWLLLSILAATLAACSSAPPRGSSSPAAASTSGPRAAPPAVKNKPAPQWGGAYYQDDGPGEAPDDAVLAAIPDATPQAEPLHRFANRPYVVFNRRYEPLSRIGDYRDQGMGSWYGRKFHGQKTSTGELYDMFAMTAAHPTLPLPSYARVTNPANGRSVVVRVNDRGPFHADRIIDLSYVAAWKLGYINQGSTLLHVESLDPGQGGMRASAPASPAGSAAPGEASTAPARSGGTAPASIDPLAEMIQRLDAPAAHGVGELPEIKDMRGVYLQLAAFGNAGNAESFKAHLARELNGTPAASDSSSTETRPALAERLHIQPRAGVYRVQLGPWADQASARQVAAQLRQWFAIEPLLVQH